MTNKIKFVVLENTKQIVDFEQDNYDVLAILAWEMATKEEKLWFLKPIKLDDMDKDKKLEDFSYMELPDYIKVILNHYQQLHLKKQSSQKNQRVSTT